MTLNQIRHFRTLYPQSSLPKSYRFEVKSYGINIKRLGQKYLAKDKSKLMAFDNPLQKFTPFIQRRQVSPGCFCIGPNLHLTPHRNLRIFLTLIRAIIHLLTKTFCYVPTSLNQILKLLHD